MKKNHRHVHSRTGFVEASGDMSLDLRLTIAQVTEVLSYSLVAGNGPFKSGRGAESRGGGTVIFTT
jgi:hypothetical protein